MNKNKKYKAISQNLKLSKCELRILRHLSRRCMSIYKKSIKNIKENYDKNNSYLNKYDNFNLINEEGNYFDVNNEVLQKACFLADYSYQSYFELLKYQKKNNLEITAKAPDYPKSKYGNISFSYLGNKIDDKGNRYFRVPLSVPYKRILKLEQEEAKQINALGVNPDDFDICSNPFIEITIPRVIRNKKIQEVSIIPIHGGKRFKIQYKYLDSSYYEKTRGDDILSIDMGVNNLMTCVTTNGNSFIVDGKRLKSMNQYYNKRQSELRSNNPYVLIPYVDYIGRIKYKKGLRKNLKPNEKYRSYTTKRMIRLYIKRNSKIEDYIYKSCKMVIDYCLDNNISKMVLGYNMNLQNGGFKYPEYYESMNNMQKHYIKEYIQRNNQHLVGIPFGRIRNRLMYLCELHKIDFILQEESYTSLASFIDNDDIPVYDKDNTTNYNFSGKREYRGMYISKKGIKINADINGALNILRKSSVCDNQVIEYLRHRGVNTPVRLRVI